MGKSNKGATLSREALLEDIIPIVTRIVLDSNRKAQEEAALWRRKKMQHNAQFLLKNYRMLKVKAETPVPDADDVEELSLSEIRYMMEHPDKDLDLKPEKLVKSKLTAKVYLTYIDEMLRTFSKIAETSPRDDDKRCWRVVQMLYIQQEIVTVDEVAERENIDRSTVYKDINKACDCMSALLFGLDALKA